MNCIIVYSVPCTEFQGPAMVDEPRFKNGPIERAFVVLLLEYVIQSHTPMSLGQSMPACDKDWRTG